MGRKAGEKKVFLTNVVMKNIQVWFLSLRIFLLIMSHSVWWRKVSSSSWKSENLKYIKYNNSSLLFKQQVSVP